MASEFPSADEIEVAEILLRLPLMILRRESSSRTFFAWGSKKRRSVYRSENEDRSSELAVVPPPPAPAPAPEVKAEATSPATPLSFSPSESDSKRKHRKRKSDHHHKEKREVWLESINELTRRKELMIKDIENVSRYYDKLKAFNVQLKAREKEILSTELKMDVPYLKTCQSSRLVSSQFNQPKDNNQELHHTPLNRDRTARSPSIDNDVSPLGIPDLNVPLDESLNVDAFQPLDSSLDNNRNESRAMASEARRKRIQIYRVKNSIFANKQRYFHR